MSDINNLTKEIPETSHEFQIDIVGLVTKKRYLGDFKCKIPTIKDQALIAKHNAMLNGEFPVYLDAGVQRVHKMISYLRFTIVEFPKFWRESDLGYDLRDLNVIEVVYDEVMAFEEKWIQDIWGSEEEKEDGPDDKEEAGPF